MSGPTGVEQQAIGGNIQPGAIQVDGPASGSPGADLFSDVGTPLNAGATLDWVADDLPNSGSDCLGDDAIASCIEPGLTGAVGGTGHWNGVRIVDGIAGNEQDIFVQGGKENDTSTWNIAPGSVGSSKYDIVQAYLANNQSELFFGMERRGNNGTTAFDFEFNQAAPMSDPGCPADPNVPCRTVGDVLFTFEMQGSGGSGSATPFIFTWDGSAYVPGSAAGIISSINDSTSTAGGPWGHVNRRGDWVLGDLDRFTFAEASAPLELLPGVDACGGSAYVQVRTRSSSTENSDLKDTTRVFEFSFLAVQAEATLSPSCLGGFEYSADVTGPDGEALSSPSCSWTFSNGETSDQCSGFLAAPPDTYTASVEVSSPDIPDCSATDESNEVSAYAVLQVTPTLVAACDLSFSYDSEVVGGADPANFVYEWTFSGGGSVTPSTSGSASGSVAVGTGNVAYQGSLRVSESRDGLVCFDEDSASATPYAPLSIDLDLAAAPEQCDEMSTDAVTYDAIVSGGNGDYSLSWIGQPCSGYSCTIDPADSVFCDSQSVSAQLSDSSGLCDPADSETETYGLVTVVTASDNP